MGDSIPNETETRMNFEKKWTDTGSETEDFSVDEESRLIKSSQKKKSSGLGGYPKSVLFIIVTEFCERFSFYGMRTILTLYMVQALRYSEDIATVIFHVFSMGCYFTPLIGAFIADSYLGKFKTIFYLSIIYVVGNFVISVGAIPNDLQAMLGLSFLGLSLIALGTGGIKPCVSAFGGDQFEPGQEKYLQRFFSFFYLSINLGSLFSTFITPLLRSEVQCFGDTTCFSLAFGVPAILMFTALVIFLIGKPLYKMRPLEGNIVCKVLVCIQHAVCNKIRSKGKKKDHWLYYADDKYDKDFLNDVKVVLHVMLLYLPLPLFWALFDQQGSRWTIQATRLDGKVFGYSIKPDQMQTFNPLLVITLIPLFEYGIYPLCEKCKIDLRPLKRITIGGLLAATAFVLAGFLQLRIESDYPILPEVGFSKTLIINNSPCTLNVHDAVLSPHSNFIWENIRLGEQKIIDVGGCPGVEHKSYNFTTHSSIQTLVIGLADNEYNIVQAEDKREKNAKGLSEIRIVFNTRNPLVLNGSLHFKIESSADDHTLYSSSLKSSSVGMTDYLALIPAQYTVFLFDSATNQSIKAGDITTEGGANYIIVINQNAENADDIVFRVTTTIKPNHLHILLQVPQYVVMTIGEIMFSITGLEFSYSQAPASMKSVLQAAWLLTVTFGNLIVVIIAEAKFIEKQSYEFFFFAVLMGVDMLIFAVMAYFYKYVNNTSIPADSDLTVESEKGSVAQKTTEDTHL